MRGLLTGVIGATLGFIAGAAFMRYKDDKRFDATIDDIVNDEIDAFIEDWEKEHAESEDEDDEEDDELPEEEAVDDRDENEYEEQMPDGYFDYGNKYKTKRDPMDKPENPADILTQHPQDPEDEMDILEESPKPKEDVDMSKPKLISADKYDDDPEYRKELLYYYQEDDVLTTEDEEEIENEFEVVGDCMDKFDFRGSEESYIHVRNPETMTDYEIQKIFAAFNK